MGSFVHPQKVLFQHCDPAGIVFYPRYFEMVNATVEEWFETRVGMSFAAMHGPIRGGVPTARIRADFRAPSRLGDRLDFVLEPLRLGRSSCALRIVARAGAELRAEFELTVVWISMESGRARPWPAAMRARIEQEIESEGDKA